MTNSFMLNSLLRQSCRQGYRPQIILTLSVLTLLLQSNLIFHSSKRTFDPQISLSVSADGSVRSAHDLERLLMAAGNRTRKEHCSTDTDQFPRNRILIIHEQHLQSMGCDVRLLRFVKDLLYLNQEVSMLFRGSTPSKMRQPKSRQLAAIMKIDNFEEEQLRKGLRKPPGIYEWTSSERFAQLMALGHFNVVITFLWFWYDPQPSVAELILPLVRSHSPRDKQPFVALLSDDAHSIRSSRLGEVEIHRATRNGYNERARNFWFRQKHMYHLADMVMHISPMDQVAEKEDYAFVKYYNLLRMPIRAFRILNKNTAILRDRSNTAFLRTANIGFIGNGMTPTNHLGIQWYLENCWEDVQRQLPGVRMRLIGRPPGERMLRGVPVPCVQNEDAHCGWAWGTPYVGVERQNGIDELGYLSSEELLTEVLSWRLMIVPVLRTTGVNTKILVALELGVPLVITPVAASPFDLPENETIVAFADQALDFVQQTVSVYTTSWLWTQLSRASRQHWEQLASHDPARNDVRSFLSTVCQETTQHHYLSQWTPPRIQGEPAKAALVLRPPPSTGAEDAKTTASSCLVKGNSSATLLVASHGMSDVFPRFDEMMHTMWRAVCQHCGLRCKKRAPGEAYTLHDVDLLMDGHWAMPLDQLEDSGVAYRMVFYHWDSGKMGTYFHFNGNLLQTVGATQGFVAQAQRRENVALTVRVNQELRSSGGFLFNMRKALTLFGFAKPTVAKIITTIVSQAEANFTKEIQSQMAAYKAG